PLAGLIVLLAPLVRPALAAVGAGRKGLVLTLLCPRDREAGVEDAAGIEGRRRGVDRGEWCDRLEVRRVELCGEELTDRAVGDSHHADLVAEDPGLVCDRLDHVVAVEVLQWLEEVIGTTGAS